ncbi:MAG: YeeE/YedE family protein [Oscillospiraceae bacterium]|jgi:uncharacterized membrane protein YedE/YeeE|nr:YeeE/YedE family protein [Oscillospiraceae bacterium]
MPSDGLNDLIQERQKSRHAQRKNQVPYAMILLVLSCVYAFFLWRDGRGYTAFWLVGIALGFVMRNSRFCFAATFRDAFLFKNTKLMRALILSLIIGTLGFAAIQFQYLRNHPGAGYDEIPGIFDSVGLHTVIGAFLFGVGMVIAGGCAASVLMRIGEGHALPLITLLGFFIGTTLGAKDYPNWYGSMIQNTGVVYLPEYMNFGAAVFLQIAVLAALYRLALWFQNRKPEK